MSNINSSFGNRAATQVTFFPTADISAINVQEAIVEVSNEKLSKTETAATATKLATARTIALSGDVTGSASFDGSANVTITTVNSAVGGQYLGTATTKAIAYNAQSIAENITIPATANAYSCGPITINTNYTVTIETGGTWVVF